MNTILYKSLPKDMSPNGHLFKVGKWYKEDNISICNRGFHASKRAIDAMGYVNCEVLAKVEVRGESEKQEDKQCWSEMRLIKTYKWTKKDSIALSIYSAELCLKNFEKEYPNDDRPRKAIEAAKAVLEKGTKKNRDAAESAARSAAGSARSAWSAAESAAESAAGSARSAAGSAVRSARSAAYEKGLEKTLNKINKWILKRVNL